MLSFTGSLSFQPFGLISKMTESPWILTGMGRDMRSSGLSCRVLVIGSVIAVVAMRFFLFTFIRLDVGMVKALYKRLGITTYRSRWGNLAKLTIMIPDELDKRLRVKVAQKHGGKKGALGEAITEAIELWLKKYEG